MNLPLMSRAPRALTLAGLLSICCGCQKFHNKVRVDFAPFAEQTIASVTSLDADLGRSRRVLTANYSRGYDEESRAKFDKHIAVLQSILKEMIDYSVLVAKLSHSEATEPEQVQQLADYLETYRNSLEESVVEEGMDSLEFDSVIASVREQLTMLEALQKAQPLINEAGRIAAVTAGKVHELVQQYELDVSKSIEDDFGDVLEYQARYQKQRAAILRGLSAIYRYREGQEGALQEVVESGVLRPEELERLPLGTPEACDAIELQLTERFERMKRVADRLAPDYEHYVALQRETDAMIDGFSDELRDTWGVIFVWSRAHAKMAQGVIDPAAWFDVDDAPRSIFRLAGAAL